MLNDAFITDYRELSTKPALAQYRQQYQAWGVAILLHLFAGILFLKIGISASPKIPVAETQISAQKIIQVQLVSMAPVTAKKTIATVTPPRQKSETPPVTKPLLANQSLALPVKTDPQPDSAKLHSSTEKSKNRAANKRSDKPILKKMDAVLSKNSAQIKQENAPTPMMQTNMTKTSTSAMHQPVNEKPTQLNDRPTPARLDARYLSNPPPEYPEIARELGQEGTVLLKVKVSASGLVLQVSVHRSSGHNTLDTAAINAVRCWKFVPANEGNATQEDDVIIPVSFSLEDA
jgi:protein TonB